MDGLKTAKILVVDDQAPNVSLLEQLLAEAGYTRVASTMNPQEVCALHRRNPVQIHIIRANHLTDQ